MENINKNFMQNINNKLIKINKENDFFKKCITIRSLFLEIIREFKWLKNDIGCTSFLNASLNKTQEILLYMKEYLHSEKKERNIRYINLTIKNLIKFKKNCLNLTLFELSKLPGHLPIDIKKYIIEYISPISLLSAMDDYDEDKGEGEDEYYDDALAEVMWTDLLSYA